MTVSLDLETLPLAPAVTATRPVAASKALSVVVLSGDAATRRRLSAAAALAGWGECVVPETRDDVDAATVRHHALVVVDLLHPLDGDLASAQITASTIAARPGTLLVSRGAEDASDHEVWARCNAAFCHVSGVGSSGAWETVLADALGVVERSGSATRPLRRF